MGKYFGTDGFRGETNATLNPSQAYAIGRFIGWYFSCYGELKPGTRAKILIGKDTRRSSYLIESALVSGIVASGSDAYLLHVTTTPSVSYVTRTEDFSCGIMITASHNPYYDNGIKLVNSQGEKISEEFILLVESYMDGCVERFCPGCEDLPLAQREKIGETVDYSAGRNRYVGYLISLARNSFKGYKVGLDLANGAASRIAVSVFDALRAHTFPVNNEPDGLNINVNSGSTHISVLQSFVKEKGLDVGFAFDGDADRCIAVDENGDVVDGDAIMYICGVKMKAEGMLKNNRISTTVMSNIGLYKALDEAGIQYSKTPVGDKYVYADMLEHELELGGEQSGHVIFSRYANTGDGIITAIMLMEAIIESKLPLSKLREKVKIYPQVLKNIRVSDKDQVLSDEEILSIEREAETALRGEGRILLRASGTEPLIRVMAEAGTEKISEKWVDKIIDKIREKGFAAD